MGKSKDELRKEAQELIESMFQMVANLGFVEDYSRPAASLLAQLEPIIFKYAPPPDRIVAALRSARMI